MKIGMNLWTVYSWQMPEHISDHVAGALAGMRHVVGGRTANLQVTLQLRLGTGRPHHHPDRRLVVTAGEDQCIGDIGDGRGESGQAGRRGGP